MLNDKIEKMVSQANTLLINNTNNMERMSNERKEAESEQNWKTWEYADLYSLLAKIKENAG